MLKKLRGFFKVLIFVFACCTFQTCRAYVEYNEMRIGCCPKDEELKELPEVMDLMSTGDNVQSIKTNGMSKSEEDQIEKDPNEKAPE